MLARHGMDGDVEGSPLDFAGHLADGFASGDRARDASKSALISSASEPPLPLLCSSP